MTETVPPAQSVPPGSSSLLRLVPRIFSRAARRDDVEKLLRTVRTHHPKGDLAIIERAYAIADRAHSGQKRQSGEPYITHPLAVAQILADLGLGPKAVAAALLHDTVEDTGYSLDALAAEFGDEVAMSAEPPAAASSDLRSQITGKKGVQRARGGRAEDDGVAVRCGTGMLSERVLREEDNDDKAVAIAAFETAQTILNRRRFWQIDAAASRRMLFKDQRLLDTKAFVVGKCVRVFCRHQKISLSAATT